MRKASVILPAVVVAIVIFLSSVFIVDEREKVLVLQFGRIVDAKEEPGLAFKIPLIQEVVRYDDRILSRDIDPLEVTPLNDRRLVVDAFARYRIVDLYQFRQAVGTGGIPAAESRLDSILRAQTREVLGSVTSNEILSLNRDELMGRVRQGALAEARELGIEIVDVRLKRTDLPRENLDATFARMRAEREREAADLVARGNEAAQRIRAQADRTQVEIVSDANRQAEIVRGQADGERNRIYAEAYGADPEFFQFYRSMSAYRASLKGENSTMVLSPDSEFFTYFKDDGAANAPVPMAAPAEDATAGETPADAAPAIEGGAPVAPDAPAAAPEAEAGAEPEAEPEAPVTAAPEAPADAAPAEAETQPAGQ